MGPIIVGKNCQIYTGRFLCIPQVLLTLSPVIANKIERSGVVGLDRKKKNDPPPPCFRCCDTAVALCGESSRQTDRSSADHLQMDNDLGRCAGSMC